MLKLERIQEFIKRLNNFQPCSSGEEAFELLAKVLNEVEDELSNIPYSPHLWMTDGRMYSPQEDGRRTTDSPEVIRYRNKGHNTFIGGNGSIKIVELRGKIIFDKAGLDGRKVDEL